MVSAQVKKSSSPFFLFTFLHSLAGFYYLFFFSFFAGVKLFLHGSLLPVGSSAGLQTGRGFSCQNKRTAGTAVRAFLPTRSAARH